MADVKGRPKAAKAEIADWVLFAAWLATIYSTLGVVRTFVKAVNAAGYGFVIVWIAPAVAAAVAAFALVWLIFVKRVRDPRPYLALAGAGAAAALMVLLLSDIPIERIHLLEYGLVGVLAYRALGHRLTGFEQAVFACLLCLNAGFLDESIQGLVPGRYYDSRDVFVNFVAASCGIVLAAAWRLTQGKTKRLVSEPSAKTI